MRQVRLIDSCKNPPQPGAPPMRSQSDTDAPDRQSNADDRCQSQSEDADA